MTQPSIATGLIGFGLAGSAFHAPLIAATPGLRLAGIASSQGAAVAAAWPDVPVFADPAALIADPSIELVVIATPNASHAPLARAALAAGRHVVIDKPFVADPEDGPALIAAAGAAGARAQRLP
ncbi:Gfo/Idh/MocA family oxidoreductase [Sphingomonas sp. SORGH_AS_0438]|uniref:Gfo/Idh/MocA family oxidoreductase n=1 Tax=Sphingomonas sp. SORGH_AS_0438 TaxID=3041756 RepID=UPI00285F1F2C|nr:Gfo/Idh/MocA family oxidoreductase [Sphingomonas sp. SORGH_AS_0438]MDR6127386.1 putative dehydrogenase [Sphingomonas sp. SORGH_AS_0438]